MYFFRFINTVEKNNCLCNDILQLIFDYYTTKLYLFLLRRCNYFWSYRLKPFNLYIEVFTCYLQMLKIIIFSADYLEKLILQYTGAYCKIYFFYYLLQIFEFCSDNARVSLLNNYLILKPIHIITTNKRNNIQYNYLNTDFVLIPLQHLFII